MKKNYVLFAAALMALASCSNDDILGGAPTAGNETSEAINFAGVTGKITRANKVVGGSDAAAKLGNKFYVLGTKGTLPADNPTETKVFDNYQVEWTANSAGATTSNTNDWEYVGKDFVAGLNAENHDNNAKQTIKYWDYSVDQYDFIAYSIGKATLVTGENEVSDGKVHGTAIQTPKKNETDTQQGYKSYTLKANKIDDLAGCYYTDVTTVEKKDYKKPVQFTFKNLTAKVRVAFYETIPGYTVSNLQFYTDGSTEKKAFNETDNKEATLYTTSENKLITNADISVTYPVVGKTAKDKSAPGYNKAFVIVGKEGSTTDTKLSLGNVNYVQSANVLATNAKNACMAGDSKNSYYTAVLPTATNGKPLTLRMNYTLTSEDGSNEKINVYGAKAVIPASYTQWQPNYAYTYIFKISDNTNGSTSTDTQTPEGLFPITFDAVVADIDNNDFEHESITTIATPSITTYAWDDNNKKVVKAYGNNDVDEYPAGSKIYFSVMSTNSNNKDEAKNDLNDKGQLYTVNKSVTEAEVIDALQVQASTDENSITGRNNVKLTKATTTYPESIPTEDGHEINVTENSIALLSSSTTAQTYAYVYKVKDGESSTVIITAIKATGNENVAENEYYTDYECNGTAIAANTKLTAGQIYYKKYTNNNNVYGVKVVKVVSNTTNPGE